MIREPGTLLILLVAAFITFLLWRRARRQSIEAETARADDGDDPVRYRLERDGAGFGFLRDEAGARLDPTALEWERDGLRVVAVVPGPHAARGAPGDAVRLEPEPDGIAVVRETGTDRIGTVSAGDDALVRAAMENGDVMSGLLLDDPARPEGDGVRILLVGWGLDVTMADQAH